MATPQRLRWTSAVFLGFATLVYFLPPAVAHAEPRPAVVELFTSEGCNSCPPAEAYIGELTGRSDVLALSFHVDYWDDLGWRDRFGLGQSVERQRSYARSLRLSSVYTPEVVIDGRGDYVGSNRVGIAHALQERRGGRARHADCREWRGRGPIGAGRARGTRGRTGRDGAERAFTRCEAFNRAGRAREGGGR